MNSTKAWINAVLVFCIIFLVISNSLTPTLADTQINSYLTGASNWAVDEISEAFQRGLTTNRVLNNYQKFITREEFCEISVKLYEALTKEKSIPEYPNPFNDVNNQEVLKAYKIGIVKGISPNMFAPHNKITRQEVCVMLSNAITAYSAELKLDYDTYYHLNFGNSFSDKNLIASWAMHSVDFMNTKGIMKGVGNNQMNPLGNTTREQAIALINRCYNEFSEIQSISLDDISIEFDEIHLDSKNQVGNIMADKYQMVAFEDDLEVRIVPDTLSNDAQISIAGMEIADVGLNMGDFEFVNLYDISISNQNKFNEQIVISMDYDKDKLYTDFDLEDQLFAIYLNEETNQWEPIPYVINEHYNTVDIYTDHLTIIGSVYIRDRNLLKNHKTPISEEPTLFNTVSTSVRTSFNSAYNAIAGVGKDIKDSLATRGKALIDTAKEVYDDPTGTLKWIYGSSVDEIRGWLSEKPKGNISIYTTDNFRILYYVEDELQQKKYTTKSFADNKYPKITKTNYFEYWNDSLLTEDEIISLYRVNSQNPYVDSLDSVVSLRIKELGIVLEEAYSNYNSNFKDITTPFNVYVTKSGTAQDDKFLNRMLIPYSDLDDINKMQKTAAHELFHAVQRSYVSVVNMTTNKWLMEVTAEYAAHKLAFNNPLGFMILTPDYFEKPLGTLEPLILPTKGEHEYRSAVFIEYLVNKYNFKLNDFFAWYNSGSSSDDLRLLEEFITKTNQDFTLGKAYLDFFGNLSMTRFGDFSYLNYYDNLPANSKYQLKKDAELQFYMAGYPQTNLQNFIPQVKAVRIETGQKGILPIKLSIHNDYSTNFGVNAYLLKDNKKNDSHAPIYEFLNTSPKGNININVEDGDILYFLCGNVESLSGTGFYNESVVSALTIKIEPVNYNLALSTLSSTRTTANIECLLNIPEKDKKDLLFEWNVKADNGNILDVSSQNGIGKNKLSTTLIHENPIESLSEEEYQAKLQKYLNDNPSVEHDPSNPFSVVIINIDDGTKYTITVTVKDPKTNKVLGTYSAYTTIGIKSPLKSVSN